MKKNEDFDAFAALLTGCAEALDGVLSSARIDLYFTALSDLAIDDVRHGIEACMRGSRFFPKPIEIREAAIGSVDDKAEMAWWAFMHAIEETGTYRSVQFEDVLVHAVVESIGGWAEQWQLERMDAHELGFKRNEFVRLYRALGRNVAVAPPRRLVGQAEMTNRQTRSIWTRGLEHVDATVVLGLRGEVRQEIIPALPAAPERLAIPADVKDAIEANRDAPPISPEEHERRKVQVLDEFRRSLPRPGHDAAKSLP